MITTSPPTIRCSTIFLVTFHFSGSVLGLCHIWQPHRWHCGRQVWKKDESSLELNPFPHRVPHYHVLLSRHQWYGVQSTADWRAWSHWCRAGLVLCICASKSSVKCSYLPTKDGSGRSRRGGEDGGEVGLGGGEDGGEVGLGGGRGGGSGGREGRWVWGEGGEVGLGGGGWRGGGSGGRGGWRGGGSGGEGRLVERRGLGKVEACGEGKVEACGEGKVEACGEGKVEAWGEGRLGESGGLWRGEAWGKWRLGERGGLGKVEAWGEGRLGESGGLGRGEAWGEGRLVEREGLGRGEAWGEGRLGEGGGGACGEGEIVEPLNIISFDLPSPGVHCRNKSRSSQGHASLPIRRRGRDCRLHTGVLPRVYQWIHVLQLGFSPSGFGSHIHLDGTMDTRDTKMASPEAQEREGNDVAGLPEGTQVLSAQRRAGSNRGLHLTAKAQCLRSHEGHGLRQEHPHSIPPHPLPVRVPDAVRRGQHHRVILWPDIRRRRFK